MQVTEYIEHVAAEGERFATAAEHGDLGVAIAPCPGWDMRELVRHLGMIHLWAAANVAFPEPDWLDVHDLPDLVRYWPDLAEAYPADADPVGWYRDTLANLVEVLKSAPADHECFTFLPAPSPLSMWARRQASEIAIHRFDAEQARGMPSHFDPHFAADMIDELLVGFAVRRGNKDTADTKVICVDTHDTDDQWFTAIGPERTETGRTGDHADLTLTGNAADLYVMLWNRTPDTAVATTGDAGLIDLWRSTVRIRWA